MFNKNQKIIKIIPAVNIEDNELKEGYVIQTWSEKEGKFGSEIFSSETKKQILDRIKRLNNIETSGAKVIKKLLEKGEL